MGKLGVAPAAIVAVVIFLLAAAPAPQASPKPTSIAIVINGDMLPIDPPPRFEKNVLFVPVRRTLEALGLPFAKTGNVVTTQVGSKNVSLEVGGRGAQVDGARVTLEAPTMEIKNVLYAPLRFFTDVLGAQAHFDKRANAVAIVAQLVGRSADGLIQTSTGYQRFGNVAGVDVLSDPPTVTLGENGSVKTVPIAANATIDVEDVNVGVTMPGELGDIRPGDFVRLQMRKNGRVDSVVDEYGSRVGKIVAVAGNQFVLADGQVVTAGRTTEVALNGKGASFSDLRPGDAVSVRYNVESNEVREVLASRQVASATARSGVAVTGVEVNAPGPLRPGATVTVRLHGTPRGGATFDIASFVTNVAMHETSPGSYEGSYVVPRGANFADAVVTGHLQIGTATADAQAPTTISASSTPPGISDFAPGDGVTVNTSRPAIYATFVSDAVPVNPSSIVLHVNGRDVTADCVRGPQFIEYMPSYSYRNGPVHVDVRVADGAGNVTTKSWTFKIEARS